MDPKIIPILCLAGLALCNGAALDESVDQENVAEVSSNRILGGDTAAEGQFPYMVSLQLLAPENQAQDVRGHLCGGALFTPSHVATTPSCIYREIYTDTVQQIVPTLRAFAGSIHLTNDTSSELIRAVTSVVVHPQYSGRPAFVNNIAVAVLASAFSANVATPIALPSTNFNPADFTLCTVAGWGGNSLAQNASVTLRFSTKYIYNQHLCMTIYNQIPMAKNILPSMVCAVSLDLTTSNCEGDNGNPLVCGGTFTGLLSQSDNCQASSMPEIYTRVSNHTNWLRQVSASSTVYAPGVFVMMALFSLMQVFYTS